MGQTSELHIEEMNRRYETDADFRREYDEAKHEEAARESYWFERELELEKFEDFFDGVRIDVSGYEETFVTKPILIDDDIPF